MPFFANQELINEPVAPQPVTGTINTGEPVPERPDLLEAAFRRENVLGSVGTELQFKSDIAEAKSLGPDEDLDLATAVPFRYVEKMSLYGEATNREEVDVITRRLDQENADREALETTGAMGVAAMMTSIVSDPLTFVPVVTPLALVKRMGKMGKVATLGAINAVGPAGQELALQATQEERTVAESAMVVGTSFLVSAYLGKVLVGHDDLMKAQQAEIRALVRGDIHRQVDGTIKDKTFGAKALGDNCP